MKFILTLITFFTLSINVHAQFNNLKGVAFNAKESKDDDGSRSEENTFYFFSFTDKMLLHQVLTSKNQFSDAQFYKLTNITKNYIKADEKSVYTFDAISGISGKTYNYILTIYDDGTGNMTCNTYKYYGSFYELKTYAP